MLTYNKSVQVVRDSYNNNTCLAHNMADIDDAATRSAATDGGDTRALLGSGSDDLDVVMSILFKWFEGANHHVFASVTFRSVL